MDAVVNRDAALFAATVRVYAAVTVAVAVCGAAKSVLSGVVFQRIVCETRNRLFEAALALDMDFFDSATVGGRPSLFVSFLSTWLKCR